ncbi:MAG: trypsin-like peptidase domain-containing protein [Chloroflexi bacterium]|nr:trypsin-like peptidase domain-containing protein [Chloroflexota bacterium]MDA1147012.1 trypsin-like peptidase domain-containing protein [Chloroflexota bacterium]
MGIALLAGAIGGVAGGLIASSGGDDTPAPVPTVVAAAPASPTPDEATRLREAIERVLPAVVTVVVDLPSVPQDGGGVLERTNYGSGIVVSSQGMVITNFHVIDGAETITVVLGTGERRPAVVVADDSPFTDLAMLRVDPTGLRAASLGDSDRLVLGQPLAAISGGVVTFENQVKLGVFSARQSSFPREGVLLLDMLQTDAAVNNGDSGGALVDATGQVVGMLTTVVRESGGRPVEGVAMAHSSNSLRAIVEAVLATGVNPRARLGIERVNIQHVMLSPELFETLGEEVEELRALPVADGALIVSVDPGSPAALAGVLPGDVVVGVDGIAVNVDVPFANLLASAVAGVELELFVVRGAEQLVIPVVPQLIAGVTS